MLANVLFLALFPVFSVQVKFALPYGGVICNVEMFQTSSENVVGKFFCVPDSHCTGKSPHRLPVLPFDACTNYFYDKGGEILRCCHQSDLIGGSAGTWAQSNRYLPGVKSYLMCKNNSHAVCGYNNKNYCYKEIERPVNEKGIPTAIGKYPHTALIGRQHKEGLMEWFCMGSIINYRHILTSGYCLKDAMYVKVGESRICLECPDKLEEQVLEIETTHLASGQGFQDVAIIVVKKDIVYNRNVRPACVAARQPTRQSQGWFAKYGKPESLVSTRKRKFPVLFKPQNESLITFKVRAPQEVHIWLSGSGENYVRSDYLEVTLGLDSNKQSGIRGRNHVVTRESPGILNENFRGFWIRHENEQISVGREDETGPFVHLDGLKNFKASVVGISTPTGTGDWIFADQEALFSLHDRELEVVYTKECTQYYPKITTTKLYEGITGDPHYVDDIVFCAGDLTTGKGPCDNDWGGSIQTMNDDLYCAWQIFGVYGVHAKDNPRNCSAINPPALFTNMANLLVWVENFAFPNFSLEDINAQEPSCSISRQNNLDPGRC